ncbi:hypothetical protein VTI74DRAFT_6210 [Chaetomium olivicolor]
MCRYCRYHFVFYIYPPDHHDNVAHLQHHFRVVQSEWQSIVDSAVFQPSKANPCQGRFRYACTLCGMAIQLEISLPRLKPRWISMIMDEARIKKCLEAAREQNPTRYADITPEKEAQYLTGSLHTLNQYLRNILDDDGQGPRKRISFRNKTFMVQFGQECDFIFRYLGFEEDHDTKEGESYWLPPRLPPQDGKTPVGSPRAFYEDVRSEVQSLLEDKPPVNGQPAVIPIPARDQLEKALGCDKRSRFANTASIDSNETRFFAILGAPVEADDAMLKFAYSRQVDTDPERTKTYLEALGALAARRAEELQMFVFNQQELVAAKEKTSAMAAPEKGPVEKAYAQFGLSRDCPEEPDYILRVYRTYREQSPAQKADQRLALLVIAQDRQSTALFNEVYGRDMDVAEACQFLHVEQAWPMDNIAAVAQSIASDADPDLLLMALNTISKNRAADDPNRPAFESVVTELRASRQLQVFSANADQPDAGKHSNGATTDAHEQSREVVDIDLPVGLANLRNTCYLNSILQYFYSVNAVRDLALNSELPALEPTEASLRNLLRANEDGSGSGSKPNLETGRAFVGHEFTRELGSLFRELEAAGSSSISPRQRLANAALLRPEKLRPQSVDTKVEPSASNSDAPPPLPPRTGDTSASRVPEASMDECETNSTGSSQTLIGDEATPLATGVEQSVRNGTTAAVNGPEKQTPAGAAAQPGEGEAKMSKLTVEELATELDKPNVGSDQMDVDEVMGNTIDHLRAAYKLSHVRSLKSAPDPIEQAFFSTFIDNRKKIGEPNWNRSMRSDRWVTAYPAQSGTRDLYDALANSFDLETLPGDLLSYTTIERPAPHFHICIQRSEGVRKNVNPITVPETLYLDRYMHTTDSHSSLFKGRKRRWDIKTRLNEIAKVIGNERPEAPKPELQASAPFLNGNAQVGDLPEEEIDGFLVIGGLGAAAQDALSSATVMASPNGSPEDAALDQELKQLSAKYGITEPGVPQNGAQSPQNTESTAMQVLPSDVDQFWDEFVQQERQERERLIAERDEIFSGSHELAYRLHAVVCHAGQTASAGHYWVWIHDFEHDVWRKYNDTTVSVHPADFVFEQLNTKGEPYYLAYVRADEVHNLVSIPRRNPMGCPPVPPRPEPSDVVMKDASGVKDDDENDVAIEYVDDVQMLPPPYVPA